MTARMKALQQRRQFLVSQAEAQRREASSVVDHLQKRFNWLDMGFALVKAIRLNPMLGATGSALMLRAPRNKLMRWTSRLVTSWKLVRAVRKQLPRHQDQQ